MTPAPAAGARWDRTDALLASAAALLSLAISAAISARAAALNDIPTSAFGVFYDGHLYIEIAKSFPLPFSPDGPDYVGHAAGYPALIWVLRLLTPDALDWGTLALVASWLPAAGAAAAFYALCRDDGGRPIVAALLFALANPRWVLVTATPRPESLAVLLVILALLAQRRGQLGWCVAWLSLGVVTRFPSVFVVAAVGFGLFAAPDRPPLRRIAWVVGIPAVVFGLYNAYVAFRVPGSGGVWAAHQIFWNAGFTWPFDYLWAGLDRSLWGAKNPLYPITYASLAFYALAVIVGFRRSERARWAAPAAVSAVAVFHASLTGKIGAFDFTRLAILAWPPALYVVWRWLGPRTPALAAAAVCAALGIYAVSFATKQTASVPGWQSKQQTFLADEIARLDSDEPHWIQFSRPRRPTSPRGRVPSAAP